MQRFRFASLALACFAGLVFAHAVGRFQVDSIAAEPAVVGTESADASIHRLAADAGLQTDPAWSPDAQSIAYASDRSGNFDIWVQAAAGGADAVQITNDPAGDSQPQWSPDGKRVVFRSEREGGGLFIVSSRGGPARRLTTAGYRPQWSPDGRRVLFNGSHLLVMDQRQRFYVVNEEGGHPKEVLRTAADGFASAVAVCWHPDGRRISIAGLDDRGRVLVRTIAIDTEKESVDAQLELRDVPARDIKAVSWSPGGDTLFAAGANASGVHLWRVPIAAETGKRSGAPEDVAVRAHEDLPIAVSPDGTRLAFTMSRQATRLWTYRLDAASGRIALPGRAITPEQATAFAPDFSADGKKLAYVLIPESGPGGAAPQELHEWTETADRTLIADGATRFAPRVSRDGRYIAYRWTPVEGNVFAVSVLDTTTLKERRVTSTSLFATPFGWAPDDQSILMSVRQAAPARQGLFRVPVREGEAPRELSSVAVNPKFDIWQGTQSPDGQWIAFVVQEPSPRWSAIFVVPKAGGQWIQITDGHGWDDKPRWSRDGHLLYFLTSRGGPFAVAAVAIDQTTGKPISAPSELMPLPDPRLAILNSVGWLEMAVGGDALAVPLVETTGGLWTTDSRGAGPGREAAGSQPCPELLPPEVVRKVSAPDWGDVLKRKSGAVQMEVVVGIDGTVRDARIVRSPDARLNPEALRAGAQWTFRPGRCGGEATTSTVPIEVSFAANERR